MAHVETFLHQIHHQNGLVAEEELEQEKIVSWKVFFYVKVGFFWLNIHFLNSVCNLGEPSDSSADAKLSPSTIYRQWISLPCLRPGHTLFHCNELSRALSYSCLQLSVGLQRCNKLGIAWSLQPLKNCGRYWMLHLLSNIGYHECTRPVLHSLILLLMENETNKSSPKSHSLSFQVISGLDPG